MGTDRDDTQSLPGLAEELKGIQGPYPKQPQGRQTGGVRELRPQMHVPPVSQRHDSRLTAGCKRGLLLALGFVVALLLGIGLAGFFQDQSAAQQAEHRQQEQALKNREEKLASQEASLRAERERLEKQKQELESRQQELAQESGRLQGRNERLQEEDSKSRGLDRVLDKMTGREKQRKEAERENKAQSEKVDSDLSQVRGSIQEAQQMLDEVDSQLSKVEAMQQEAESLRRQAEKAYLDNKGTIDEITDLLSRGLNFVNTLGRVD